MKHYCTYFDSRYLHMGLAMHSSLQKHSPPFTLWVLCLDEAVLAMLNQLQIPNIRAIPLSDLEVADPELAATKKNRSMVEFFFTCSPCWPLFLFDKFPEIDSLIYVDADLYFFGDISPIDEEFKGHSVLICGHRFPAGKEELSERFGIYNVGILAFRKSPEAKKCLEWWRGKCIEWCYDRSEDGKFADQKYLDDWPTRFSGVRVLSHEGCGLAPWNLSSLHLKKRNGVLTVNGTARMIFYHFHGLRIVSHWLVEPGYAMYLSTPPKQAIAWIYRPYVRLLKQIVRNLRKEIPEYQLPYQAGRSSQYATFKKTYLAYLLKKRQMLLTVGHRLF